MTLSMEFNVNWLHPVSRGFWAGHEQKFNAFAPTEGLIFNLNLEKVFKCNV